METTLQTPLDKAQGALEAIRNMDMDSPVNRRHAAELLEVAKVQALVSIASSLEKMADR